MLGWSETPGLTTLKPSSAALGCLMQFPCLKHSPTMLLDKEDLAFNFTPHTNPGSVLWLLARLGVDPRKPFELWEPIYTHCAHMERSKKKKKKSQKFKKGRAQTGQRQDLSMPFPTEAEPVMSKAKSLHVCVPSSLICICICICRWSDNLTS